MSEVSQQVWRQLQHSDSRLAAALLIAMLWAFNAGWRDENVFLGVREAEKGTGMVSKTGRWEGQLSLVETEKQGDVATGMTVATSGGQQCNCLLGSWAQGTDCCNDASCSSEGPDLVGAHPHPAAQ